MARKVAATTLAGGLVAAGIAAGLALADADRRNRMQRSARVWRLTARRGAHYAVVKVRGARKDAEARAALEQQFAIRTAEDVARELGNMKGAIMKAGQLISFIAEGLPPEAQAALATLQADVPPMAPSLAESVIRSELGDEPSRFFLDWNPIPVAAASIGQVHQAVLPDGRMVAVKVQYPGVDRAIRCDLDNAEMLYSVFSSLALKGLDVKGLVDELRARMVDELDYRIEAANQEEFGAATPGTRSSASRRSSASCRLSACSRPSGSTDGHGPSSRDGPTVRRDSAPPRCCSASRRDRCTAMVSSTAIPTRATTGSMPTARSRSSTSVS